MALPREFQESYIDRDNYPCNYTHRSIKTFPSALKESQKRLDEVSDDLFETDPLNIEVSFRDLKPNNGSSPNPLEKKNIHSHTDLTEWLGIRQSQSDSGPRQVVVSSKDPKSRFIYIFGEHTLARLWITRPMLTEILTFHQVTPDYLDFMSVFGLQSEPRDHRFSSFREQRSLRKGKSLFKVEALARSGRQYQMCFNLKGVTLKNEHPEDPTLNEYSIRPAAFYHRFDVENGNALWIVTKGGRDVLTKYKELTGPKARPEDMPSNDLGQCFRASLSAHLLFCHWSMEDWRGHIKWLEFVVDDETKIAVVGNAELGRHQRIYTAGDMQKLLMYEEMTSDVITSLESNSEVMRSLKDFYERLALSEKESFGSCEDDIEDFISELGNLINDCKLHISRAKALVRVISNRSELVNQQRMERLNKNLENEAIVMRIITIVTLLYLPATFVSTLFSTDIVKYQVQDDIKAGGTYSHTAMMRWLQVTLPLMFFTMSAAYLAKKWAERRANQSSIPSVDEPSEKTGIQTRAMTAFLDRKDQFQDNARIWSQHSKLRLRSIFEPSTILLKTSLLKSWIPKKQSTGSCDGLPMSNITSQGASNV